VHEVQASRTQHGQLTPAPIAGSEVRDTPFHGDQSPSNVGGLVP
jgi:hypothetical protein